MFCSKCGSQVANGQGFCPRCGNNLMAENPGMPGGQMPGGQMPGGMPYNQYPSGKRAGVDNIFSALVYEKKAGTVWEFSLWCVICIAAILSLIAMIVVKDDCLSEGGYRAAWVFMMIFTLGLGVGMAFRVKTWVILGGSTAFFVIMPIFIFSVTASMVNKVLKYLEKKFPGLVIAIFIVTLLVGIALVACSIIHFVTRYNLGIVIMILSIVAAALMILLIICTYAVPSFGSYVSSSERGEFYNSGAYWLGNSAYMAVAVSLSTYTALFFTRVMTVKKDKIYNPGGYAAGMPGGVPGGMPGGMAGNPYTGGKPGGLKCVQGGYPGQKFYIQGPELVVGSAPGSHILLQDPYVSAKHCVIRFNPANRAYEVMDVSTNGTYLNNGMRLPKGSYQMYPAGSVICFGSMAQQFRLL